jgi:hypothetical protein
MTTTDIATAMTIKVGRKTYQIPDFATASRLVCEARDRAGIGGSRFTPPVIYRGDEQVAYVSYNGRVWAGKPGQWKPGCEPLYDNGSGLAYVVRDGALTEVRV